MRGPRYPTKGIYRPLKTVSLQDCIAKRSFLPMAAKAKRMHLKPEHLGSDSFSDFKLSEDDRTFAPYVVVTPGRSDLHEVPTILAISGGEQMKVSTFFLACRADARDWQVVIPLRKKLGTDYLYEGCAADRVESLATEVLEGRLPLACRVEGRSLHLVGNSNGSMSVLELARRLPGKVSSVTLIAGISEPDKVDLEPLRNVRVTRLFVGRNDEFGHCNGMEALKARLDVAGIHADLHVLPDAGHENIGRHINLDSFWRGLLDAREASPIEDVLDIAETLPGSLLTNVEPASSKAATALVEVGLGVTRTHSAEGVPAGNDAPKESPMNDREEERAIANPDNAESLDCASKDEYSLHELQQRNGNGWTLKGLAPGEREQYLSENEFMNTFGIKKDAFVKLPKWRRDQMKREHGLF